MRRARPNTERPRGVSSFFLPTRSTSIPPRSSSSAWMLRLKADWVMCSFSAARLKEPVSASASQCSKCLRFMYSFYE